MFAANHFKTGTFVSELTSGALRQSLNDTSARNDFGVLPASALPRVPELARAAAPVASVQTALAPASALPQSGAIFASDHSCAGDILDHAAQMRPLAELAAHKSAQTPLAIALLGAAGTGKTMALRRLVATVAALAKGAAADGKGPFLNRIACVTVDASALRGEAGAALADAVHASLCAQPCAALAREAAEAAGDPHLAARETEARLDTVRLELDRQRATLAGIVTRRGRLAETVLNETPGSAVDAYARGNRGAIESRLRGFGFGGGDPVANYKDLVRDLADSGGSGVGGYLRATWAFKGQTKLLVWAALLLAAMWGLGFVESYKTQWIDSLMKAGLNAEPVATWLLTHANWLGTIRSGFGTLALALVALNLLRALRFMLPLSKGVSLLRKDVEARSVDLDASAARQEKRVQGLEQDAARHEHVLRQAEQRTGRGAGQAAPVSLLPDDARLSPAGGFLAQLGRLMRQPGPDAPQRIVVAIDNLEAVSRERAANILNAAARDLAQPGFAVIVAADPARLDGEMLARNIDVPFNLASGGMSPAHASLLALNLLGHTPVGNRPVANAAGAGASLFDRPLAVWEAKLLSDLAPLAGRSARSVKRFVNLYRLARGQGENAGALALMLALDLGGTPAEVEAVLATMARSAMNAEFETGETGSRLAAAVAAARQANGGSLSVRQALAGMQLAQVYSARV